MKESVKCQRKVFLKCLFSAATQHVKSKRRYIALLKMPKPVKKKSTLTFEEQKLRRFNGKITPSERKSSKTFCCSSKKEIQFLKTRSETQKEKSFSENSQCIHNQLKKLRKTNFRATDIEESIKDSESSVSDQDEV